MSTNCQLFGCRQTPNPNHQDLENRSIHERRPGSTLAAWHSAATRSRAPTSGSRSGEQHADSGCHRRLASHIDRSSRATLYHSRFFGGYRAHGQLAQRAARASDADTSLCTIKPRIAQSRSAAPCYPSSHYARISVPLRPRIRSTRKRNASTPARSAPAAATSCTRSVHSRDRLGSQQCCSARHPTDLRCPARVSSLWPRHYRAASHRAGQRNRPANTGSSL